MQIVTQTSLQWFYFSKKSPINVVQSSLLSLQKTGIPGKMSFSSQENVKISAISPETLVESGKSQEKLDQKIIFKILNKVSIKTVLKIYLFKIDPRWRKMWVITELLAKV